MKLAEKERGADGFVEQSRLKEGKKKKLTAVGTNGRRVCIVRESEKIRLSPLG
jgi:Fe2+ transport system protein FeoA